MPYSLCARNYITELAGKILHTQKNVYKKKRPQEVDFVYHSDTEKLFNVFLQ